jgi:hypothetical protein
VVLSAPWSLQLIATPRDSFQPGVIEPGQARGGGRNARNRLLSGVRRHRYGRERIQHACGIRSLGSLDRRRFTRERSQVRNPPRAHQSVACIRAILGHGRKRR